MRSLSLPCGIEEYAKEIRLLEDRILSDGSNLRGGKLRRSMSTLDKKDSDEELVLKHSTYNTEGDFFLGEIHEDPQGGARADRETEREPVESFLPGYVSGTREAPGDFAPCLIYERDDELNSSTRELHIESIAEDIAEEQSHLEGTNEKERQEALETLEALSGLFELPSVHGTANATSPVSVRDLWQDHMRHSSENNENTDDNSTRRNHGAQGCSAQPRRSIFGGCFPSKNDETSPSWSGFGIFAVQERAGNEPSLEEEKQQRRPSQHQFRILNKDSRSNSMPPRLPRKSSLKRIPSMQSSSTDGDGSRNENALKSVKRTVSFGKLETREFSIALSDHPSCSYGPPISLGWDFCDRESVELDKYEEDRSPRRAMHQMILSYNVRRYLLLKRAGYSHDELEKAMSDVERVKRERLVTDLLLPMSKIDETVEDVVRRMKTVFGGRPGE